MSQVSDLLFYAERVMNAIECASAQLTAPHVLHKPLLQRVGVKWRARLGEVAGFGRSPSEACEAFDVAWSSESGTHSLPMESKNG